MLGPNLADATTLIYVSLAFREHGVQQYRAVEQ